MAKPKISEFLDYYAPHAIRTKNKAPIKPPENQWGYVMGADGRTATDAYLQSRAKSSYPSTWKAKYNDTKKWLGRRVFDCNSLAEHFYKIKTGTNIDTKARLNYANWCSVKSSSKPDAKLTGMPQLPGTALFSGGSSASGISHVGFLFEKYGAGLLDWWVLEARGRKYGVVITKLKDRGWRYWGKMDKRFEYDIDADYKPRTEGENIMIKQGDKGPEVYDFQQACIRAGYVILQSGKTWKDMVTGKINGADGDFGAHMVTVTKSIQAKHNLPQTGEVDGATYGRLVSEIKATDTSALESALKTANAKIAAAKKALA